MIWILVLLSVTFISPMPPASPATEASSAQVSGPSLTVVRGRAVCYDASGREVTSLFGCPETGGRFGFASSDGNLYKFLPGDTMTPVFTDSRVRQSELQLTARLHGLDQLEIIKVQSIKAGKLYDIFYYCDICSITAYVPGPCPCCRNELEFREKPQ